MNAVLWDETEHRWRDVLLDESASDPELAKTSTKKYYNMGFVAGVRASDYVPLWCGACDFSQSTRGEVSERAVSVVRSLMRSGLVMPGGIASSLRRTGHQWDFPNAWAPLVHALVEGCHLYGGDEGKAFARQTARRWIKTNAQLLKTTKFMHEKYDARVMGSRPGGGGEYAPQRGFGWTNGVVLFFLNKYVYDGEAAEKDFKLRGAQLSRTLRDVGAERKLPSWW
jgi:alpha,alpha-trehalase